MKEKARLKCLLEGRWERGATFDTREVVYQWVGWKTTLRYIYTRGLAALPDFLPPGAQPLSRLFSNDSIRMCFLRPSRRRRSQWEVTEPCSVTPQRGNEKGGWKVDGSGRKSGNDRGKRSKEGPCKVILRWKQIARHSVVESGSSSLSWKRGRQTTSTGESTNRQVVLLIQLTANFFSRPLSYSIGMNGAPSPGRIPRPIR